MKFWDSSAVVPFVLTRPSGAELLEVLDRDGTMLVWWGTPVECTSAIARREREGRLEIADAAAALSKLRQLESRWHEVLPSPALRRVAERLLRMHPLRVADSLQLAAAIIAAEHEPSTLEFVCLDQRLAEAASREGFPVLSP